MEDFSNKEEEKSQAEKQSRSANSECGLKWRYLNLNSELMIQLAFHFVKLHESFFISLHIEVLWKENAKHYTKKKILRAKVL